ncbi:glycosyltransferase family 2 protein [Streptomyces sp. NPDC008196]|uniref:glycosyltransferase family 2 protein n=1 Tax=unclassified Streptomyces TaxID=2593676 RepID=UPI001BB00543|nr:glycosyltransferase [Streptomyces sp. A2-16]QUC55738.1 glycosyltransferase family 2 protein [Streptomyces sp. A2-16]
MGASRIAVAVVTMGNRPEEVDALLRSVAKQDIAPARIVIVGNGCRLPEFTERLSLPGEVTTVDVEENLGCPGGRNVALARLRDFGDVDVVVELDDDGLLADPDVLRRVQELFAADERLGIVGFRIADESGETQQRHVPRVGSSDPMRGGHVTGFLGGGHAFRMAMLDETGDWPAEFFFAHEEIDLAWRAVDHGWHILYAPELLLQHPRTSPARHAIYYRVNARNRVWLVRRRLPLPLIPVHLGVWTALTLLRTRSPSGLRAWFGGFVEGLREPAGERRPMRWRTVWRLTRLGRPPVI